MVYIRVYQKKKTKKKGAELKMLLSATRAPFSWASDNFLPTELVAALKAL